MRPTRAVIDHTAIAANYRYLSGRVGDAAVFPVVKADGYGHGAVAVSQHLEREGADRFAVGIVEEALALREGGIRSDVLIMGFCDPQDAPLHRAYRLMPTLQDLDQMRRFADATRAFSPPLPVHLKIDSGMGRLGLRPESLSEGIELLRGARGLTLVGTFTQLARAHDPDPRPTDHQIETFRACLALMADAGLDAGLIHAASSAAILSHASSIFAAVRPGLALYGVPSSQTQPDENLKPALELETRVMSIKKVPAGSPLGYGGLFVTERPTTVAVLPIGYHDGVRRSFSGRASVLIRGERAPIVGAVSMDLTLVDATGIDAQPDDRAVVLGRDGQARVTAWDLARAAQTAPYEILCGISARVPRVAR